MVKPIKPNSRLGTYVVKAFKDESFRASVPPGTQRNWSGSPASYQSRIWEVIGMVTHGRGIGPFEIWVESKVVG
jgi:hypothetical protein